MKLTRLRSIPAPTETQIQHVKHLHKYDLAYARSEVKKLGKKENRNQLFSEQNLSERNKLAKLKIYTYTTRYKIPWPHVSYYLEGVDSTNLNLAICLIQETVIWNYTGVVEKWSSNKKGVHALGKAVKNHILKVQMLYF